MKHIPFNKPSFSGNEIRYIVQSVKSGKISGDGVFSKKCTDLMEKKFHAKKILLTPSGTAALDMTALLLKIQPGDEIICPSFTFTSTINAFVLQGGKPVFVDILPDTLNIDENKIEAAITPLTRTIYVTHYAGVGCEMDIILKIAKKHKLPIVEDAAQGVNAKYKDKYLGTIGDLGIFSFHETKNYNCGEGGALVINNPSFINRAEIIREKGTNRSQFFRGEIDKYTWCDLGSSYLLSDILAAYLYAQLEKMKEITAKRKKLYLQYFSELRSLEKQEKITLPTLPKNCSPNYHIFYILFKSRNIRNKIMHEMKNRGILSVFHYIPLHSSPMGKKFGYQNGQFPITESVSEKLLRLPLYNDLTENQLEFIIKTLKTLL